MPYFDSIPAEPDRSMILTRLGYRKTTTVMDERQESFLEEGIRLCRLLCRPRGIYQRFGITENSVRQLTLHNGVTFESESLCRLLEKSHEAVLMAATVGRDITERISKEIAQGEAALGLILDAAASETADACLDWMMSFVNRLLEKEGVRLTNRRYSPGYGDLGLHYQRMVFDALKLEKLDLYLTETYMLVPEKSVIAIAGIERIEEDGQKEF